MAEQLTITIPDELSKRLKAVRDDVGNVSAIAAECIEHAVKLAELDKPGISHIEKLRKQKEVYDQDYYKQGEEDAVKDFKEYSYKDLVDLVNGGYKSETYQDIVENKKDWLEDDPAFNLEKFMEGWFEKMKELFEKIKNDLE